MAIAFYRVDTLPSYGPAGGRDPDRMSNQSTFLNEAPNPFNPQPLIYHLTNRRKRGII
jgi:hypothetical protein